MTVQKIESCKCTGCNACSAICNHDAICMSYDNEGFLFPYVNTELCIDCGICLSHCPVNTDNSGFKSESVMMVAQLRDTLTMQQSASGGISYALAQTVIEHGGIVVGCVLDKNMLPVHIKITEKDSLFKIQGSKYVQSIISAKLYREIASELKNGKELLFTGTPCQVAGLKSYLGKEYENLFTVDLICHGVASRGVWKHYVKTKEKELGNPVTDARFRSREVGKYPNNHSIELLTESNSYIRHALHDPYGSSFYHNRILRESCYHCPWATKLRISDITLGDYGETDADSMGFPSREGYSIVIVNTNKGQNILKQAEEKLIIKPLRHSYTQINLMQPTLRPSARDEMKKMSYDPADPAKDIGLDLRITLADRLKMLLPNKFKYAVKRLLK